MSTHSDRTLTKAPHNIPRTIFLWKPIISLRFWQKITSTLQKLFSEKNVLSLNSAAIAWQNFCVWKPILFLSHYTLAFDSNNTYLEEIILRKECTSTLQKLLSEKNKLSPDFPNAAWHKYFCENPIFFSVIMHQVFTEITSLIRNYSLRKTSLISILQMLYDRNIHVKTHTFSQSYWIGFCKK